MADHQRRGHAGSETIDVMVEDMQFLLLEHLRLYKLMLLSVGLADFAMDCSAALLPRKNYCAVSRAAHCLRLAGTYCSK